MLFASSAHSYMSGVSLMLAALYLYFYDYRRSGDPLHLRALFSLFWVGGEGISCLKLSRLQKDWEFVTWAAFFVALAAFWSVYGLAEKRICGKYTERSISYFLSLRRSPGVLFYWRQLFWGMSRFFFAGYRMPIPSFIFPVFTILPCHVCWCRPWRCSHWLMGRI